MPTACITVNHPVATAGDSLVIPDCSGHALYTTIYFEHEQTEPNVMRGYPFNEHRKYIRTFYDPGEYTAVIQTIGDNGTRLKYEKIPFGK